jgi:hypothetical protein
MSALESLLEQALRLPDAERGKLAMQLLRTLGPEDEDELGKDEWEAAWSAEIDRRVCEIDDGSTPAGGHAHVEGRCRERLHARAVAGAAPKSASCGSRPSTARSCRLLQGLLQPR